ncbi:MAG: hypothetical protein QM795_07200 [Pseudoxanthomonas sp.]
MSDRMVKIVGVVTIVAGLLLLAVPLILYVTVFGSEISSQHSRWGEMGSAMAGLYTPIFGLFTLIVFLRQTGMQLEMNKLQADSQQLANARSDFDFFSKEVARAMSSRLPGGELVSAVIRDNFDHRRLPNGATFSSVGKVEIAKALADQVPELWPAWGGIQAVLDGMDVIKEPSYEVAYTSSIQRLIVMLRFDGCVALDNYLSCLAGGRERSTLHFRRTVY